MRRLISFAPMLAVLAVAACETMQGAGRDMQTAGAVLTEQAAISQTQINSYTPGGQPAAAAPY